jgi:hypothetical protein
MNRLCLSCVEEEQLQKDEPGLGDVHIPTIAGGDKKKKRKDVYTPPQLVVANAKRGLESWEQVELAPAGSMALAKRIALGEDMEHEQLESIYLALSGCVASVQKDGFEQRQDATWQEWFGLGGQVGLAWSRRMLRKISEGNNKIEKDFSMEAVSKQITTESNIVKIDDEQHIVYAWASMATVNGVPHVDQQGDTITDAELEKAANHFVLNVRDAGEMHDRVGVGKLVASIVFTPEIQKHLGIDLGKTGWFTGWKITDDNVWKKIKSGEYGSMSIHGTGMRKALD